MPLIIYKNKDGKRVPSFSAIKNQWGANKQPLFWHYYHKGEAGIGFNEQPEATVGTLAHMMVDYEVKGKELNLAEFPMDMVEQAKTCYSNWQEWKSRNKFEPVKTEISLVSEKHQFGGTIDCIAMINDKLSIMDLKTGKDIYEDHILQIVAYEKLWQENFPEHPITGGYHIIRTGKEIAMFAHYWYGEFPYAWKAFLMLRKLYDYHKEIKKLK